ncbi:alpha-L-arabinofuranosidase C-terminal domain-containing protein [Aquisphaera insulae]|uniref:alpha-L-arabinofuranosidase C-terminal domain-containing protein n=1 Tax=Aquisphaera insulae TaxID=2712864 RepID=UPI0013ED40D4|nr:alpha-L-arabinofuranosidase C-terminal domain-containing protein [Aquisphaera insulae]
MHHQHPRVRFILSLAFVLGLASRGVGADQPAPLVVKVEASRTGAEINPFIYGQFIEHLGRCIYGGIWAEMLEDRKFYYPVTGRYAPYTSLQNTRFPVVGSSPWEIAGATDQVTMVTDHPFVGRHTPRIQPGAAIVQNDLGVVANREYVGYLWARSEGGPATIHVTLSWGGDPHAGMQSVEIKDVGPEYAKYAFSFRAGDTVDSARFEVIATGHPVRLGTVSLMPADNVRGLRADTLALLKQLGGTMYRWPGGNFVSGYDWRDGLGDRDRRPPRKNPAWTGVEHNDFGLHEFLDFCREVGAEPVIAVNTGFGDEHSAALEVEYCNRGSDTAGGAMRAKNGVERPFGVRYWCVGNEMWGPWQLGFMQLSHYTQKHNLVADAMWRVDPSLKLIGSGQLGHKNPKYDPDEKRGWSEGMLAECSSRMNLISEHFYCDKKPDLVEHTRQIAVEIRKKAEGERRAQERLGLAGEKRIPIAMDEWNYWGGDAAYGEAGCTYDLADALGIAAGLHEFFRNSDIISMAHYAQTVNVLGCIKTTKTTAFLDATALPLMLYRRRFGTIPVAVSGVPESEGLDVAAAWTADRRALTIGVVNASKQPRTIRLEVAGANPSSAGKSWVISGNDAGLKNSPGKPGLLAIAEQGLTFDGSIEVAPLSIKLVQLPVN